MITSTFYYPVTIFQDGAQFSTLAPVVGVLPLDSNTQVVILSTAQGEQDQGVYVFDGALWRMALTMQVVSASVIRGDALSFYVYPDQDYVLDPSVEVYKNTYPQVGDTVTAGKAIYAVRTPPVSGGGGGYVLPTASASVKGGVLVPAGSNISVDGSGALDVKDGAFLYGAVTAGVTGVPIVDSLVEGLLSLRSIVAGNNITVTSNGAGGVVIASSGSSYVLPAATTTTLGGVSVGSGLSVNAQGLLTANAVPTASAATLGLVRVGSGLAIDGTGILSVTAAGGVSSVNAKTGAVVVAAGSGITIDNSGASVVVNLALTGALVNTALGYTPYNGTTNPNGYLTANQAVTLTGDVTGTGTSSIAATLSNTGVTAGTYRSVTVDAKGRVGAGTNPTTLAGYEITDAISTSGGTITGGNLVFASGAKPTGLPAPVLGSDATNKDYVDQQVSAIAMGVSWKQNVRAASVGPTPLTALQVVDGVSLAEGDRFLYKDATDQTLNGVYIVSAGPWTRAIDVDTGEEIQGMAVLVLNGTVNALTQWVNTNNSPVTIGTTNITYTQLNAQGSTYTAGAGLTLNTNEFSITPTGVAANTYTKVTVNTLGQVTAGAQLVANDVNTALGYTPYNGTTNPNGYLTANAPTTLTGDVTGTGTGSFATTLSNTGVTAGTYTKVTVDAKGRVSAGAQVTNAELVAALGYTPVNRAGDTMTGALEWSATATVASAATTNIGAATSNSVSVTGTTTITSFGASTAGALRLLNFAGILTLTYNATSLVLPTAANITTQAGDSALFVSLGGSNWKCVSYLRADGTALSGAAVSDPTKLSLTGGTMSGALNLAPAVTLASAASVAIGAAASNTVNVTGTTAITSFDTIAAGARRTVVFAAALTLTHNATSLILPTSANIVTAAGDVAEMLSLGGGNWKCVSYQRQSGAAVATTFTQTQRFQGSATAPAVALTNATEVVNVIGAAPAATQNIYLNLGAVQYHTVAATGNWVFNLAFSSTTALNAAMAIGESMTVAVVTTQGATAYLPSSYTIDGVAVTPRWQGGVAPTVGNVSGLDTYTFTAIKTGNNSFTLLAAQTQYK